MVNRPTAQAESQDLSRGLELKVSRRPWNPSLHPRDSKGRFIETGGIARLWAGNLARVVRALPRDRILVQDQAPDGTYTGRRHSTSARWVTMVARPDGSAPTKNQQKVEEEDARRDADDRRGLGLSRDDSGDPDTSDNPHNADDEGNAIGDDDGDGPDDGDDQDEPEDGDHDVDITALPNRQGAGSSRFKDTAAVRQHFLALAQQPGANATALRRLAGDEDLQVVLDGGLVTTRDDSNGLWYLTASGTGAYLDGDFATRREAEAAAAAIHANVRNGHIMPGELNEPIDFSDPNLATVLAGWRSTKSEDAGAAITRAIQDFRASRPGNDQQRTPAPAATAPAAPTPQRPADDADIPEYARAGFTQSGETGAPEQPQTDTEANGRPAGVPADAEPVDGVDGYWSAWNQGNVTVYGPDGTLIGRVEGSYEERHARVDGVYIPIANQLTNADQIIARHHLATVDPSKADHVTVAWTTHKGKRIIAIRGTIKNDAKDDKAVGAGGKLPWSGMQSARVTTGTWKPETRDRKTADILAEFARQGRNVRVVDEDATPQGETRNPAQQLDEDTKKLRAMSEADLEGHRENLQLHVQAAKQAGKPQREQRARAALQKIEAEIERRRATQDDANKPGTNDSSEPQAPEPAQSPQERAAAMGDSELRDAIRASERERGTYGNRRGEALNDDERALYEDRRRRTTESLNGTDAPEDLSDEDLSAHIKRLNAARAAHNPTMGPGRSEDDLAPDRDLYNDLGSRLETAERTQQLRKIRNIEQRKPVQDLTDDELSREFVGLPINMPRLTAEEQRPLKARNRAVYAEKENRKADKYRNRPDVAGMDDEALNKEFLALNKDRSTVHGVSREALDERVKAVFDEQNRRAMKGREAKVRRAETNASPTSTYTEAVHVDGSRYGSITYHAVDSADQYGYKAGWNASKGRSGSRLGAYPTLPEALAAIVDAYDGDPDTEPQRLYGTPRAVWVPKMFFELYQSNRRADSFTTASKERQTLYSLFASHKYGWSDGTNPLTGKSGKGARLEIPEGLLAELQRVSEEMSREMMLRSTDRELDSSDRSKARSRLASINAALHTIGAKRETVRKDGGDDDLKVISRADMEAQQAALRAALANDDEGADGERLQPGGQGPLDEVPAEGTGGDGRPGEVLPEQGQGDRDGDSGGRGGTGDDRAGGDGVRGPRRTDQADQGDGNGSGAAGAAAGAGAGDRSGAGADAGDAGSAGAARLGVRHVAPRFRPNPADAATKGPVQRAAANVEAIRVMKRLEREQRPANDKEKRTLARWTGWGSVPIMFAAEPQEKEPRYQQGGARHGKYEQDHARWAEYRELRTMLSDELTPVEWRQASRGTMSMHYTPQPIAEAMWDGLKAFGFERGEVLEAGSGAGTFFGVSPEGAHLTGIELDPTTARIAQAIYPDANVLNENFAETDAEPGTFDVAIGNVPFASVPFGDKRYPAESLHNGFITKELALTRPGGITLLITSRHTLDSKGTKARQKIAQYGDLVGAVRLPAGVFNDAGTNVVTDVLVLRRRADGDEPGDQSWINAPERKIGSHRENVNTYFTEHPEHVLGDLAVESSPYGPRLTVKGNPGKAAEQLRDALKQIAEKATADGNGYEPHPDGDDRPRVVLQTAREKHANDWTGRLYEGDDGQLYQHVNGGNPVPVQPSDGRTDQLRALMQLRDVAAELRTLDRKNAEDGRAEKLRAQLGDLHTAYVSKFGPLSKPGQTRTRKTGTTPEGKEERTPTAFGYFRFDPDAGSVLALERWDAEKGEPVLSRVFTERAAARRQPLESTDDPKTALSAVVAAHGRVDLREIARLLNTTPDAALQALGNEVFTDPATGRLELAGAYLSGAVRNKLAAARKAAERDPAFQVNVAALEAVQPPERTIGEFTPEMGAHWTPPALVQGFLREYLGDKTLHVAHDERYGWILHTGKVPQANNVLYGVAADPKKGTKGRAAVEIARALLGNGSLTVYRDDKQKDVDEETSRLVRQKADQMRSEFAKYATADSERLTTLTNAYNGIMNGHVVRSYDGMSPSLDGLTPDRTPHAWQLSGAARMQFERSVVLAHEVGLGKTGTLVMGTQALKSSGQIEKPFAVVPDHLAQQWYDEARFLYPNADVHLITSADLADGRRDATLEWLRANKADLVIFTEPAFGSIKMSPEAQDDYEFRELEALREQLDRQYEDASNPDHPFIVAKIEQRIATVQNRISKNAAPMRTPGETYWDDLGFDYAVIDEAHRYKGVGFRSKEGGGDPATIRGIDLHQKLTDLHTRRGERATVTLATGTPLSNSITEQYTMLALAAPWILDSYNAGAPDLWAATFGRKTLRVENAPDGSGLRIVERFSEFHNRRAMKTMWGLVADTKRADDVGIPRPKVKGGGPNLILVGATKDQTARLKGLVGRGRAIHEGKPKAIRNRKGAMVDDNMLTVSNEGTSVALDPRLIDPKAPAGNKLKAVADKHVERYHQHKDRVYKTYYGSDEDHPVTGALQMVFLNEGVPGGDNKGGFDAYAELKRQMVAGGIPAEKIAFVQDVKKKGKPEEVAELFRKARDGEIAVLIGSSSVAGTGMNAQNRMVSLTHVDLDWGAAQMEQRNGRVLRYGNQNAEVEIDIFATKGSLDGWKAGFVASKAEGLVDIQRPEMADSDTRDTVTELDVDYPDYETMEAEIGGNPYMSQLMKARRSLRDLEIDQHNEAAERVRRAETLTELQHRLKATREAIALREEVMPRIQDVRGNFTMTMGGLPYRDRGDAGKALHRQVATALLEHNRDGMGDSKVIGMFGGLDVEVRTERRADGTLVAHVGFRDLARSDFERTPEDLKKKGVGAGMITRLENALQKAPDLQAADRDSLPGLDEEIALLQTAQASADLTPQIQHARARANLLDDVVGKIADLDKLPEIDESELDKKLKPSERAKIVADRREERIPLQAAVGAAKLRLEQFDEKFPAPERAEKPQQDWDENGDQDRVQLSADEVAQTLDEIRPGDATTGEAAPDGGDLDEEQEPPATPADAEANVDDEDTVHLTQDEVNDTLAGIQPNPVDDNVTPAAPAKPNKDEEQTPQADGSQDGGSDEPPADAPNTAAADDGGENETDGATDGEEDGGTLTLDQDDVAQQLDAIRPEGVKAPTAMSDQEIADEIVSLMEREMADGELTGADRTRMAVLEAEKDRRAGRTPKAEPKKPAPAEPEGGLFDVDEPEQAPQVVDPNNPLDQPDDEFGTPDMFADHEGRDTSRLRPVDMRNPAELAEGDRYIDAEGRTHTVAEPPKMTGRGRVRIVTEDGEERFYSRDAELRLRHPDEDVNDDDNEAAPQLGDDNDQDNEPGAPDVQNDDTEGDREEQENQDDEQRDDDGRRGRDLDADGAAPDEAPEGADGGPQTPDADGGQGEGASDAQDGNNDGEQGNAPGADTDEPDADEPDNEEDEDDRKRRRRRRRRGGDNGGPGGPGGPGMPGLDLPHLPDLNNEAPSGDGDGGERGDGRTGGDRDGHRKPIRSMDELRQSWRNGDRLTNDENTPARRAFLAALADNPTLTLSTGGGLITWTDDPGDTPDGMRTWQFAQARNGGRFGNITLTARDSEQARELADLFELTPDANGHAIDWNEPLSADTLDQWRDSDGRPLPKALRSTRDLFQGDSDQDTEPQAPTAPQPEALPDDLTALSDDELAAAWGRGLSPEDQERAVAEMDRRDAVDQRVRDAIPATPAASAAEVEARGKAMDAALGFGDADVTRRPQTEEERMQREFQDFDEARYSAAIDATNGYFFSRNSRSLPPVDERDLFSGGTLSRFGRWKQYASEELIEWYDNNGGRITYNQFKQQRRHQKRIEQHEYAEQQKQQAANAAAPDAAPQADEGERDPNAPRFANLDAVRDHLRAGQLDEQGTSGVQRTDAPNAEELQAIADDKNTRLSKGGRLLIYPNDAARNGAEYNRRFRIAAPGNMLPVVHDNLEGFGTQKQALRAANALVEHVRDAEGQPFPWDAPDAAERARAFRGPNGETLADTITRVLTEHAPNEGQWGYSQDRAREREAWRQQADEWHRQQEADGYTVVADPNDLQPGDEVTHPTVIRPDGFQPGPNPIGTNRATITEGDRYRHAPVGIQALGSQDHDSYRARGMQTAPDGQTRPTREVRPALGVVRRKPRPDELPDDEQRTRPGPSGQPDTAAPQTDTPAPTPEPAADQDEPTPQVAEPETRPEPEPIGGQPAHWAAVGDLQQGDMARIDGTTRRGRAVTRAGYVLTAPETVSVTRRGRTEDMLRTTISESPDGRSGDRGVVYTPLNASAARAEAPDTDAPTTLPTGAQGAVIDGNLPDRIATDTRGRGLFPGTNVTGSGDRQGTVTGVTDTTVSIRWADGDTDNGIAPASLTADDTTDLRPAGWTATGQRIRPGSLVANENGTLGAVDEVDGDRVTISTGTGPQTHDASRLRVVGEVRDETPQTEPVTGISDQTAGQIAKGDVVVLDIDGTPTTVEILDVTRDGDRTTFEYVDTTTGLVGGIDMDSSAVVHKAEGADGKAPELGPEDAPAPADDMTVQEPVQPIDPVDEPTITPDLTPGDRDAIADNGQGPEDDPDAQQAAARINEDLPVTAPQAAALAAQLRANADPATLEGRAALRAATHLDQAAGQPPAVDGFDHPRPSNAAQIGEGDVIAMPDERRGDEIRVFRVIDVEEGPGGVRSLLLEDEDKQWKRRIVHGAMPVWQLPEPAPQAPAAPDADDAPDAPQAPAAPTMPVTQVRPGSLKVGDVIDAPTSRAGYAFNGHRRLTIIAEPRRNGWWMQLTGIDDDGNVHDFGLHNGRDVNVYERNRPTPALPPTGTPDGRDPNPTPQSVADQLVDGHARTVATRIIDNAIQGTDPAGDIHALREQIAQRLTPEALRDARNSARQEALDALDAAEITGADRDAAKRALRQKRDEAQVATVRAALRTINDLEPLPGESDEELAARARDLLQLIPDHIAGNAPQRDGDGDVTRAVAGHADDAVNALLQQLQAAGVDPGDAEAIVRNLMGHMDGTRPATARRIARRVAANNPAAGRQPGLLARIIAALVRLAKRLGLLLKAAAEKIAEKWRDARERLAKLRAFLARVVRRIGDWPESRRMSRLHRALHLPQTDGETLSARIAHWAELLPETGRFGQAQRRVTWWQPTTWAQLAAGRLPGRSDRIRWAPDQAADGGPGLTGLRHLAALRAAGTDIDQDVTRRLADALGHDFGGDPHGTLRHADDYLATAERRLVNLQAAHPAGTIPDPEIEVEIEAARAEAATARREWEDLRTRYAAAIPDAVAATLADVRDLGPQGTAGIVFGPGGSPDAERAIRDVQQAIPRAWLANRAGRRLTAVEGDSGRYEPATRRATVADLGDDGLGTAAHALGQHLAATMPDLDAAQRAWWFTRTHSGRPGARRPDATSLSHLFDQRQTQPDRGDSLARSLQAMFNGDWFEDDDMRAFLLGLMATR
ncbi:hypothetical protein GTY65_24245 [Streptomyces sp. SID8379]|uniref:hypothetical protein n=1 Tax=unclassified Streptomyces TaxID=2593676 RepID=UPI000370780F|nr:MULTISPECIES: hypothetical protein [unclassified Streptomyces]MYW67154.1 hypothetical protein [Streptomyces sp. SID8379]